MPGFKANVDHTIVSGKSVLLIDSKIWKPGFYGSPQRGQPPCVQTPQLWLTKPSPT